MDIIDRQIDIFDRQIDIGGGSLKVARDQRLEDGQYSAFLRVVVIVLYAVYNLVYSGKGEGGGGGEGIGGLFLSLC